MPVGQSCSGDTRHDQVVRDALDLVCSSSEQSYEEFLASFTHLPIRGTASDRFSEASGLCPSRQGWVEGAEGGRDPEADGPRSGGRRPSRQDQLDGSLALSNYSQENGDLRCTSEQSALPGQVEEELPAYTPSFCHHTLLELHAGGPGQRAQGQGSCPMDQAENEDVLPFRLDDDFDYDHVLLSQKHPSL